MAWRHGSLGPGRSLEGLGPFEHAGEHGCTLAFGGQDHHRAVADLELDPGTAVALEVDELDQSSRRAGTRTQPNSSRHHLPCNYAPAHQLFPLAFTILTAP